MFKYRQHKMLNIPAWTQQQRYLSLSTKASGVQRTHAMAIFNYTKWNRLERWKKLLINNRITKAPTMDSSTPRTQ